MTRDNSTAPTLRSKLANKALVGIKTSDWHGTDIGSDPIVRVKAKVGDKLRPGAR